MKKGDWVYVSLDISTVELRLNKRIFIRMDGTKYACVSDMETGKFLDDSNSGYSETKWPYAIPAEEPINTAPPRSREV